MLFAKQLREGVRRGRIRCSVRIWARPHVRVGGRYVMDEGQIVVDSIVRIRMKDITRDLAQESGFASVKDLLQTAKHGSGDNVYVIRFHYLAPGAWDVPHGTGIDEDRFDERRRSDDSSRPDPTSTLLHRIRSSSPAAGRGRKGGARGPAKRKSVAEKARVKPRTSIAVLHAVPDVVESLRLPKDVRFVDARRAELVFLFVGSRAELESRMPSAISALPADAAIWVFFRKGSKAEGLDMNRNDVWAIADRQGLSPLGLVSVDDTWSAFRLKRAKS